MAALRVEPGYRGLFQQLGLTTVETLFDLPSVIVGCHPGRHVARVTLGEGPRAVRAYLKRELRVSWKERLLNWWAGFGFVSRSLREAHLLDALRRAGMSCPEVIAAGEDRQQGSCLLLREMSGCVDLRTYLRDQLAQDTRQRRRFARQLARTLAGLHAAGFDHPDLYSKHVLVHAETGTVGLLDWQRSRCGSRVGAERRCRDLAALNATLSDALAPRGERLLFLRAYLRASAIPAGRYAQFARRIDSRTRHLLKKRRIRELRQEPLAEGAQDLVPRDNRTLFVMPELGAKMTADFRALLSWAGFAPGAQNHVQQVLVELPGNRKALLTRRRVHRPSGWFQAWLRRRPLISPEREQADALFRLQRYGVAAPRLLAYGQRQEPPWRQESLLLIELPDQAVELADWLTSSEDPGHHRSILQQCGRLLRRMHQAGCYLGAAWPDRAGFLVEPNTEREEQVLLSSVEYLEIRRQPSAALALRDLQWMRKLVGSASYDPVSLSLFLEAYLDSPRLTPDNPWLASQLRPGDGGQRLVAQGAIDLASGDLPAELLTTGYGAEA